MEKRKYIHSKKPTAWKESAPSDQICFQRAEINLETPLLCHHSLGGIQVIASYIWWHNMIPGNEQKVVQETQNAR